MTLDLTKLREVAERMRNHVRSRLPGRAPAIENGAWQMMLDSADNMDALIGRLEKAEAENERLREALQPFAEVADDFDADGRELRDEDGIYANTAGDFRRARSVLNPAELDET